MTSSANLRPLIVTAGHCKYPVVISRRIKADVYRSIAGRLSADRVFLICDANFYALHGPVLESSWRKTNSQIESIVLPSGERQKRIETISALHDQLIGYRFSPGDLIVACGGGVTSDIVGFAAATLYRGVRWGICATTLLSMVDASIGGKTGINHPKGKNLIGAFWQPSFVISDLEWLRTLPAREFRSGAAEIIKSAGLSGGHLFRLVSAWAFGGFDVADQNLGGIVRETAAHKAKVVAKDERDGGIRQILNLGHTVGHGIEQSLRYRRLTHGEAVLLGMQAAILMGKKLGITRPARLEQFSRMLSGAISDLPKAQLSPSEIFEGMQLDKKRDGNKPRFVLLSEPGKPVIREVPISVIKPAIGEMINLFESRKRA